MDLDVAAADPPPDLEHGVEEVRAGFEVPAARGDHLDRGAGGVAEAGGAQAAVGPEALQVPLGPVPFMGVVDGAGLGDAQGAQGREPDRIEFAQVEHGGASYWTW